MICKHDGKYLHWKFTFSGGRHFIRMAIIESSQCNAILSMLSKLFHHHLMHIPLLMVTFLLGPWNNNDYYESYFADIVMPSRCSGRAVRSFLRGGLPQRFCVTEAVIYTCVSFQCVFPTDRSGRLRRPPIAPLSSSPFLEAWITISLLGRVGCSGVWRCRSLNIYNFVSFHIGLNNLSLCYCTGRVRRYEWGWRGVFSRRGG